jgi:hypothetical protein
VADLVKVADADAAVSSPPLTHWTRLSFLELMRPLLHSRDDRRQHRREQLLHHRRSPPGRTSLFRPPPPSFGSPCSAASDAPHLAIDRAPR